MNTLYCNNSIDTCIIVIYNYNLLYVVLVFIEFIPAMFMYHYSQIHEFLVVSVEFK